MAYRPNNTIPGNFTHTIATAGATELLTVSNTDNTNTASNATIQVLTGGASAGDARYSASTTTTEWSFGVDNSVTSPTADPFVISQGAALGTNNVMSVATSGEINYPLQPAFLVFLAASALNVVGNTNAAYKILFDTEVFDQNGDYATSTFTAPVTGRYQLSGVVRIQELTALMTYGDIRFVASNRTLVFDNYNYGVARTIATSANFLAAGAAILMDMDAADTCSLNVVVDGGAGLTADIVGGATGGSYFSGYLAC